MKFPTKIPNRKTKTKTGKGGITPSSLNESIEILKLDSSIVEGKGNISLPQFQAFTLQKAAAGTVQRTRCTLFLNNPQRVGVTAVIFQHLLFCLIIKKKKRFD